MHSPDRNHAAGRLLDWVSQTPQAGTCTDGTLASCTVPLLAVPARRSPLIACINHLNAMNTINKTDLPLKDGRGEDDAIDVLVVHSITGVKRGWTKLPDCCSRCR
jgi:hypothetical protein